MLAHAEDNTETDTVLSPVVVEETLPPAFQTYPELSTGQVSVIEREAFQADDHSVADVLETSPGIQIQSTGELGSYSTLSVRGATGQQSLVFLDGILLTGAGGGAVDLSQIPLDLVESIEVYRTSAPPQFSQDAMGGVINIVTRKGSASESNSQLAIKLGSFGLREIQGAQSWVLAGTRFNARASALSTENDFPYLDDAGTPDISEDDEEVRRNNADYERYTGSIDATRQIGIHQWRAALNGLWSKKSLPAWNNDDIQNTYYQKQQVNGSVAWSATGMAEGRLDQSLRYRAQYHKGHLNDPSSNIGLAENDSTDTYTNHRIQHLGAWYWGMHITTLVNELSYANLSFTDDIQDLDYTYDEWTAISSLTDEWTMFSDRLSLTGSVKHHTSFKGSSLLGASAGARYDLSSAWTLKVNSSRTFRQPSLFERYGNEGYFQGNDDLQPEASYLYEASIDYERDAFSAGVTLFYRKAMDSIAPVYDAQGVGRYVNIGQAEFQGTEWQLAWDLTDAITLDHQGSYQRSLITSPVAAYDGNRVPGFYPVSHSTRLQWVLNPVKFFAQWQYEEGLYYDRANSTRAPERTELNLGGSIIWGQTTAQHKLQTQLDNVLDHRSMDVTRKPLPGRHFTLRYSLSF